MGVYFYIINRTLKQRYEPHLGKWREFDLQDVVEEIVAELDTWSTGHDIWAVGDDGCSSVKYYPREELPEEEIGEALENYEAVGRP